MVPERIRLTEAEKEKIRRLREESDSLPVVELEGALWYRHAGGRLTYKGPA
jgi:hypothetical protein